MSVKANEFKKFFDGNSSYMSGVDFTVALGAGTKVATITGLPFTLIKESVMGGMFWDITNQRLIANEVFEITTAPSVTITFTNADNFDGTEDVLFILKGPNRLSAAGGINSAVVDGDGAGNSTDPAILVAGFDGTNFRLIKTNSDGEMILASYSVSATSDRVVETDPLDQKFLYEETELTNITSGTTGYIYFDMDGFKSMGIQSIISGAGTLEYTLEATIQNDGTAPTSCTYQDVTSDLTGSASFTASDLHFLDTPLPIKYLRLKYVTTVDVTNLTVYSKKLY